MEQHARLGYKCTIIEHFPKRIGQTWGQQNMCVQQVTTAKHRPLHKSKNELQRRRRPVSEKLQNYT